MENYDILKPTEKLMVLKTRANKLMDKFNMLGDRMHKYEVMSKKADTDSDVDVESSKGDVSIDSDDYFIDGQGGEDPLYDIDRDNPSTTTTEKGSNQKIQT